MPKIKKPRIWTLEDTMGNEGGDVWPGDYYRSISGALYIAVSTGFSDSPTWVLIN